jgi:hypothetical protein
MIAGVLVGVALLGVILAGSMLEGRLIAVSPARAAAGRAREAWVVGPRPTPPSSARRDWTLVLLDGPSVVLDLPDERVVMMSAGSELHVEAGAWPRLWETSSGGDRIWLSIHAALRQREGVP